MKKIAIILAFVFGIFSISKAQTTTSSKAKTSISKQDKAAIAAQKKADKEAKALAKKQAKEAKATPAANTTATHLNKNGTPDKRFKANKQPKVVTQTPAPEQTGATTTTPKAKSTSNVAHTNTPKTPDKSIGTDAKGRTIYQGPRGGKYYLTKNGNKEYVK